MNHNPINLFKNNLHLFTEKYPHYSYLGWEHFLSSNKNKTSKKQSFVIPELAFDTNCLILLGLDGEDFYPFLKTWLYHHPGRRVLLILKSVQEFLTFSQRNSLKELLHLNHLEWLICAQDNPEETIQNWLFKHYYLRMQIVENIYSTKQKKAYLDIKEKIKVLIHILHQKQIEEIFFEKNLLNYFHNLLFLSSSGIVSAWKDKFKNIPAILCGAGNSLQKDLPFIQKAQNSALIISAGSGCKALCQNHVFPHLAVACDPTSEEINRFHHLNLQKTILVYSHRLNHEIVKQAPHLAYFFTGLEKGFDPWIKKELSLEEPIDFSSSTKLCFSSSILALNLAIYLGCNPIIFCGMDLSFTDNKHYIEGIKENPINEDKSNLILKKDIHKKPVFTKLEFLLEKESLSSFLKQYPKREFYYSSSGLGIAKAKNRTLEKLSEKYLQKEIDLTAICLNLNKESKKDFVSIQAIAERCLKEIQRFIKKTEEIVEKLEHFYPKALLAIHEMKEEENYSFLVEPFVNQWRWRSLEALHSDEKKEKYQFILQGLKRVEKNLKALFYQK